MDILKAEYSYMRDSCVRMEDRCHEIYNVLSNLVDTTKDLDIFWDGDANSSFITQINEDLIHSETILYSLRESIRVFGEAISEYQNVERTIGKIIEDIRL